MPFITAVIYANGQSLQLERLLIDTGSGGTIIKADHLVALGVIPLPTDRLRFLHGIGGDEAVIEKSIDALEVGELRVSHSRFKWGAGVWNSNGRHYWSRLPAQNTSDH